jgi:hypothetical protein
MVDANEGGGAGCGGGGHSVALPVSWGRRAMEMEGEAGHPGLHDELAVDVGRQQNTRATRPPGSA